MIFFQGSPSNPCNLKSLSIDKCRQCVIISKISTENSDSYLVDKSSVLCALNIKHIQNKINSIKTINTLTALSLILIDFENEKFVNLFL